MPSASQSVRPRRPVVLLELASKSTRHYALQTSLEIEIACAYRPVPDKPPSVRHLDTHKVQALRSSSYPDSGRLVLEYTEYETARALAIGDNINRLRGAIWLLSFWCRAVAQDERDHEALKCARDAKDFLREHWGIRELPTDAGEWQSFAEEVVLVRAKRESA